jgi:hypothetical protein
LRPHGGSEASSPTELLITSMMWLSNRALPARRFGVIDRSARQVRRSSGVAPVAS